MGRKKNHSRIYSSSNFFSLFYYSCLLQMYKITQFPTTPSTTTAQPYDPWFIFSSVQEARTLLIYFIEIRRITR